MYGPARGPVNYGELGEQQARAHATGCCARRHAGVVLAPFRRWFRVLYAWAFPAPSLLSLHEWHVVSSGAVSVPVDQAP